MYELETRVRGFGANPDSILSSPTGNGKEDGYAPIDDGDFKLKYTGKISQILYDCFGDFEGLINIQTSAGLILEKNLLNKSYCVPVKKECE